MNRSQASKQLGKLLQKPSPGSVRSELTMGKCCLLAVATRADFDIDSLNFDARFNALLKVNGSNEILFDCKHQFDARLELINAYHRGADLRAAIQGIVAATQSAWSFQPTAECSQLSDELGGEPSSMTVFEDSRGGKAGLGRYADVLRAVAREQPLGWTHPGLQLAGEMLAKLVGDLRQAESQTSAVVMFAVEHPIFPQGVLARLHIERVAGGCGLLVPDADYCGYLWMRHSFSVGLQNAWIAARGYASRLDWNPQGLGFDWRWRLDLLGATQKWPQKPPQVPLVGRSAEVAFACAMIASAEGNPDVAGLGRPMDPHVAATACLETDSDAWRAGDFAAIPLKSVDAIKDKTLLGRADSERLSAMVVAGGQPEDSLPIDSRFTSLRQETLQDAYGAMVRFPRITRAVNQVIIEKAGDKLRSNCDPYIPSDIEAKQDLDRTGKADRSSVPVQEHIWKPLTRLEKSQLTTARLWTSMAAGEETSGDDALPELDSEHLSARLKDSNRIWVCSESGLGKSMFILRCQMKVAKFGEGAVPIRVGRTSVDDNALSDFQTWEKMDAADLVCFLGEFLDAAYPPESKNSLAADERLAWMQWLLRNGKGVFLLDALDQSDREMKDLSLFLANQVPRCPAILTGRFEAETNQAKAFRGSSQKWLTLRLAPFDRRRQTRYLGNPLADELLPEHDEVRWDSGIEEKRRHQWKDLLEAPLLLKLLKDLAKSTGSESLRNIHSRYDLYDRAVQHLIDQAPDKIEDGSQRKLIAGDERDLLEEIAWFMQGEHDFTNLLSGDRLADLKRSFKSRDMNLLEAVVRINLATLSQVVERSAAGVMAFRHRSFMEFFAGCYFARRTNSDQRQQKLEEIHHVLDSHGQWLPEALSNANRPAAWLDTLRFALSAASVDVRHELASKTIELGNPWCIYHSIDRDKTDFGSRVDHMTRWLVHREWSIDFKFTDALQVEKSVSVSVEDANSALKASGLGVERMLGRSTRDASWLTPLREMKWDLNAYYVGTSRESSLLEQMTGLQTGNSGETWNFLDSFVPVSGGRFDISRYEGQDESRASLEQEVFELENFQLADFPVTNELFELFCPTHRRWRDRYSDREDQPAIYVSWYMAQEFCQWLSCISGRAYRLPTEWEWEWACRWRNERVERFWWGAEMDDSLCWYGAYGDNGPAKELRRTRGRSESITSFAGAVQRHPSWQSASCPGLLDLSGNVIEWCENRYVAGESSRSLRGGSWNVNAIFCRSADRNGNDPGRRDHDVGFRLCCE